MFCAKCGGRMDETALSCCHCGAPVRPSEPQAQWAKMPIVQLPDGSWQQRKAWLLCCADGRRFPLNRAEFSIGKDPACPLCLADKPGISRVHAVILELGGEYYLADNHSTNGVRVGGQRIVPGYRYLLRSGMRFTVADTELEFTVED